MTRYIDWGDVCDRYKDAATYGDATTMDKAYIAGVEAEIDGRLARLYPVPFPSSPAPDIVRDLCIDLTYVKLTRGKVQTTEIQASLTSRLKDILTGALTITINGTIVDRAPLTYTDAPAGTMYGWDDPSYWDTSSSWQQASAAERLAT